MPYNTFPDFVGEGWDIKKRIITSSAIEEASNGAEFITSKYSKVHYEFDLQWNYLSQVDRDALEDFIVGQLGPAVPFYLSVVNDNTITAKNIAGANGVLTTFALNLRSQAFVQATTTLNASIDWMGQRNLTPVPRTNRFLRSAEFDNAAWSKTDTTVTANSIAAPDGTTTADLVTEGTLLTAQMWQSPVGPPGVWTASIFLKRGNTDWARIMLNDQTSANGGQTYINLATGVVSTTTNRGTGLNTTAAVQDFGGGWYRIWITSTLPVGTTNPQLLTCSATAAGNATKISGGTRYQWGAQMEAGSACTGYIPTTTVAVSFTDFSIDAFNNIVFGSAPLNASTITWTGTYAYLVRFKDDAQEINQMLSQIYEQGGITFRTRR